MDAFDPQNEKIDRYLRGELHGKELDAFLQNLTTDPSLKKEMEFRELLVRGIQDHGNIQLKNYLKQKTTQKRGLFIGYKSWHYAAAAVGLVLVGSIVVLLNMKQSNQVSNTVAKETTISQTPPQNGIPKAPETPDLGQPVAEKSMGSADKGATIENAKPEVSAAENAGGLAIVELDKDNIITVASNIQVIPIRIESPIEKVTTMSNRPPSAPIGAVKRKTGNEPDSTYDAEKGDLAKDQIDGQNNGKFKLNFYSSKDAAPQIAATKKDALNTEILVFNLPYDNPLLLTYKSKMYLKTGTKYYEIDLDHNGKQKATPVTDLLLLKALDH